MGNENQFRHSCVRVVMLVAAVMLSCGTAMAQKVQSKQRTNGVQKTENVAQKSEKYYDAVEVPPSFPGGPGAMLSWISSHIQYPAIAKENKISGRVVVQLIVEKDGSVSNVNVVRSIDPSLDREAVRVVSSMPKWTPGKVKGSPVRVKYTLPVAFKLQQ